MPAPPDEENLWSKILDDVQSRSSNSMPQASILILGDNDSGKTTLVARLQRVDDPKRGSGLEYHYLEVNPDLRDGLFAYQLGSAPDVVPGESARLGVWVLDGDAAFTPLLRHALPPRDGAALDRRVVLLCASMAEPGAVLDSLQHWAHALERHLASPDAGFDRAALGEAREKQIRFWQEYVEPLDSSSHSETGAKVPSMETDHILLPLSGSILTHNVGLPIVVVITKCDAMSTLEKEYDFKDEHFDFMQQHIRMFCLRYGAALVYTSVKDSRNIDVLYKYILHRVYGFPFTQPALVVEKETIFIPAGWDNEKKISILHENLVSMRPDELYSDNIKKPLLKRPLQRELDIQAENEQHFLARQLNIMNTQTPPQTQAAAASHRQDLAAAASASPSLQQRVAKNNLSMTSPVILHSTSMVVSSSGGGGASVVASPLSSKKTDSAKTTPMSTGTSQEGMLAQFFNNLLSKKTSGATSPASSAVGSSAATAAALHPAVSLPGGQKSMDKMTYSNETAAAELNRMLGTRTKSSDDVQNSSPPPPHQQQSAAPIANEQSVGSDS